MAGAVINYVPWQCWVAVAIITLPATLLVGLILMFVIRSL